MSLSSIRCLHCLEQLTSGLVKSYPNKSVCDILLLTNNQIKCNYRKIMTTAIQSTSPSTISINESFQFKKALILAKFSRYEFEKRRFPAQSEEELITKLKQRGSDYHSLIHHHQIHRLSRDKLKQALEKRGVQVKMVNRLEYQKSYIDWADVIFTSGGDGTFLMAASQVNSPNKPMIGINSDPSRSIGHLCLPAEYSSNIDLTLDKLFSGQFRWFYRQRIRITLEGENAEDDPIELHNQQLMYPEYRYLEPDEKEHHHRHESFSLNQGRQQSPTRSSSTSPPPSQKSPSPPSSKKGQVTKVRTLPVRALNEVFVGESLSSRVSYIDFAVDNRPKTKFKCSGVTICTGTGSTSWSFNINRLTPQSVRSLFEIIREETGRDIPSDDNTIKRVTKRFNDSLIFDASKPIMAYSVRDPIDTGFGDEATRGFAHKIEVKSRMFDACVVVDGGLSYKFNDGTMAKFEIREEDALRTVEIL